MADNILMSPGPMFHDPMIWHNVLSTFLHICISLGLNGHFHLSFNIILLLIRCDLYFIAQWYCITSESLFNGFLSFLKWLSSSNTDDIRNTWRNLWHVFHGPVISQYCKYYKRDFGHSWNNFSVWRCHRARRIDGLSCSSSSSVLS